MRWIALAYSLPSTPHSTQRVGIWRRLRRLGAIAPVGSIYFLPALPECTEAFQWLSQEIQQAQGEAVILTVEQVAGITDQQFIDLFNAARQKEYEAIDAQLSELEASSLTTQPNSTQLKESIFKLRRQYAEIARIDFFNSPARARVGERLEQALAPQRAPTREIMPRLVSDYIGKHWVTRPLPHVDRLACAWLIRRFIDAQATIRYAAIPEADEVAFDMNEGQFGHQGNLCTFETMLHAFGLNEPGLHEIGEMVHEIDLRDGKFVRPEIAGIDAVLNGWHVADLPDHELEVRGIALFEGLYLSYQLPGAGGKEQAKDEKQHSV
jgi:hypothetical protein